MEINEIERELSEKMREKREVSKLLKSSAGIPIDSKLINIQLDLHKGSFKFTDVQTKNPDLNYGSVSTLYNRELPRFHNGSEARLSLTSGINPILDESTIKNLYRKNSMYLKLVDLLDY
jgi:hypothetical protein